MGRIYEDRLFEDTQLVGDALNRLTELGMFDEQPATPGQAPGRTG